ncbi:MAG: hypothetical protein ACYTHJ_08750 [Planctomycetota bacterium]|jgi:hypothetical protein
MSRCFYTNGEKLIINFPKATGTVVAGVAVTAMGVGGYYVNFPIEDAPEWTIRAVGIALIVAGLLTTTARTGAIIDRRDDNVTRWFGLLLPMFHRRRRVQPQQVRLHAESYTYRGHTTTWYPITLLCAGGKIHLGQPDAVMQAWSIAQAVANHLGIELLDETESCGAFA